MGDGPQEKPLFGAAGVYRGMGAHLTRLDQFEKAKAAYDQAYQYDPENIAVLIGRSDAWIKLQQVDEALEDANKASVLAPHDMNTLRCRAGALSHKQEFEKGLVLNHKGILKRRQPPYFSEGISTNLRIIDKCVGKGTGQVLVKFLPLIREVERNRATDEVPNKKRPTSRIPCPEAISTITQDEARRHKLLSRVLANRYFESLCYDKFFLEELLIDPRLNSANSKGNKALKEAINTALASLNGRQALLRSQCPYYAVKLAEAADSKHQAVMKKKMLISERFINIKIAEQFLKKISKHFADNRMNDLMSQAVRMQKFLDSKPPHVFPNKDNYVTLLYRLVGRGYLYQHRLSYRRSEKANRRRIAFLMGVCRKRPSSFDSVIANAPYRYGDLKDAVKQTLNLLSTCENMFMKCWLFYELSWLLCYLKDFTLAKYYAKRCQLVAEIVDSASWWLNGCFALMSCDLQQGDTNEIKIHVEDAIEWANRTATPAEFKAFLQKCLEMSQKVAYFSDEKATQQREKEILDIMDPVSKNEAELLFRQISYVPFGRRFSVLPQKGVKTTIERHKYRQPHLTIVPGPPKSLPRAKRPSVAGYQIFNV